MKNVTITLEEEVARWVRIWAAEHETSVSRFVGDLLKERMLADAGYAAAMKQYLAQRPRLINRKGRYPMRDELHDRGLLR